MSLVSRGKITPLAIAIVLVLALTVQVHAINGNGNGNGNEQSRECQILETVPLKIFPVAEAFSPSPPYAGRLTIELWDKETDSQITPSQMWYLKELSPEVMWMLPVDELDEQEIQELRTRYYAMYASEDDIWIFNEFIYFEESVFEFGVKDVVGSVGNGELITFRDTEFAEVEFDPVKYDSCHYELAVEKQCSVDWQWISGQTICHDNVNDFGYGTLRIYLERYGS